MTSAALVEAGVRGARSQGRVPWGLLRLWSLLALVLAACGPKGEEPTATPVVAVEPGPGPVANPVSDRVIVLVASGLDPDLIGRWRAELPSLDRMGPGRAISPLLNAPGGRGRSLHAQLAMGQRGAPGSPWVPTTSSSPMGAPASTGGQEAAAARPFWVEVAEAGVPTRLLWVPDADPARAAGVKAWLAQGEVPAGLFAGWTVLTPGAAPPAEDPEGPLVRLDGEGPWTVDLPLSAESRLQFQFASPRPGLWRLSAPPLHLDLVPGSLSEPVLLDVQGGAGGKLWTRWSLVNVEGGVALSLAALTPESEGPDRVYRAELAGFYAVDDPAGCAGQLLDGYDRGRVSTEAFHRALTEELVDHGEVLLGELRRRDARLVMAWFPQPGMGAEAFVGLADSRHPRWNAELAARHGGELKSMVSRLDELVGKIRATLQPGDRLIVLSDHAIGSQRVGVDLNAALVQAGLLRLDPDALARGARELPEVVDWTQPQVFVDQGDLVFVHEPTAGGKGASAGARRAATVARVRALLQGLKEEGRPLIVEIRSGSEAFPQVDPSRAPELVLRYAPGVGPMGAAERGRVGRSLVSPRGGRSTGGRQTQADRSAGLVFTSVGIVDAGARLDDVGPTVRAMLGLDVPADAPGRVWSLALPGPTVGAAASSGP